jgi:hypothetical protein
VQQGEPLVDFLGAVRVNEFFCLHGCVRR